VFWVILWPASRCLIDPWARSYHEDFLLCVHFPVSTRKFGTGSPCGDAMTITISPAIPRDGISSRCGSARRSWLHGSLASLGRLTWVEGSFKFRFLTHFVINFYSMRQACSGWGTWISCDVLRISFSQLVRACLPCLAIASINFNCNLSSSTAVLGAYRTAQRPAEKWWKTLSVMVGSCCSWLQNFDGVLFSSHPHQYRR
jgi:hypothetical protein